MNERIRELAEQACFKNQDEESITYFAELIIKECAEQSMIIGRYNTPSNIRLKLYWN